jgi:PAS domain S-box-containing protein
VVGALAEVSEAELSLIHPAVLRYRDLAIDSKILDGVEAFVTAWQVENEARVNSLQFTGYVCLLATIATLALTRTVVFAPMVRQVRREATELQAVNARLNSQTQQLHREIEERIQTLSALRQSEEQFRALFESAGADMAQTDPNSGRFLRVNAKFCEITAYSREELRDMSFLHLAHPDHRDAEASALLQLQRTTEARYAVESRYLRKGGHVIHSQVIATLVPDAAGHPQSIVAVIQDITARKLAEAALSDSEERLRAVVDAAADAIITIDDRGTVVTFNRAAVKIFGCSQEQIIGNSSRRLLPEWSLEDAAGSETQPEPSGQPNVSQSREIVGRRHDGSLFPAELSSSELKVGPWRMWTWIVRDITDHKRTAEALRSSQERMRLVLQSTMNVVITMNDRGLIPGWNPQAEQTFGWTADEALGAKFE